MVSFELPIRLALSAAVVLAFVPFAADRCQAADGGAYTRTARATASVPFAPPVTSLPARLQDGVDGYAIELPPSGPPLRAWYTFGRADFYGSLQHLGGTLPALYAYDVAADGQIWYVREGADWGTLTPDGSAQPKGPMQSDGDYDFLEDLAIDPRSGVAYVATIKNLPDDAVSKLYGLDLETGAMRPIGDMGNGWIVSIAINCDGELVGEDVRDNLLYRIDPQTAARTAIGPTDIAAQMEQGLAFDRTDGTLYSAAFLGNGVNQWGRFDLASGAFEMIAQDPDLAFYRMKLAGSCPAQPQDVIFADGFEGAP